MSSLSSDDMFKDLSPEQAKDTCSVGSDTGRPPEYFRHSGPVTFFMPWGIVLYPETQLSILTNVGDVLK